MDKRKILIVEDDGFFRALIYKKFMKEGFDVTLAGEGKEAFEYLELNMPDVIILDLILPNMNGYEILSILKQDKKTSGIPVIILSNLGQQEEVEKAKSLGAEEFLTKVNFTLDDIVEKVKKVLKEKYI